MTSPRNGRLDETAMRRVAGRLAGAVRAPLVVYLQGDLGAGKTTLARALIEGLGYGGRVKSPTYGLLEHYTIGELEVLHLDLYRIADPGELEFLGILDLIDSNTILLVEWPERGMHFLPAPDLTILLRHAGALRELGCRAHTDPGEAICQALAKLIR